MEGPRNSGTSVVGESPNQGSPHQNQVKTPTQSSASVFSSASATQGAPPQIPKRCGRSLDSDCFEQSIRKFRASDSIGDEVEKQRRLSEESCMQRLSSGKIRMWRDSTEAKLFTQSSALWESEYPVLTSDFYDMKGQVNRHPTFIGKPAPARMFFHVSRILWRSYFSIVMEGVMRCTQTTVVIKMISKNCDPDKQKQVMREHQVLASHVNTCPFFAHLHSSFQTTLHVYLISEFIEGGSLEDRLRIVKVYPEKAAIFYMAEICLAIFFLHQRGIIHRDLRLKNILLRGSGHIAIIDLGLAKTDMKNNFTNTIVGVLKAMAPEMHHNVMYNKSVDYWAMGLILYTLLHGELPFGGKTRVDIFKSVTQKKETYNKALNEATSVALCKALLKKNQKNRLGYEENSEEQFKSHKFFADVRWSRMERQLYTPPYIPSSAIDEDDSVSELTWLDLADQNDLFAGIYVPRHLSLATIQDHVHNRERSVSMYAIKSDLEDLWMDSMEGPSITSIRGKSELQTGKDKTVLFSPTIRDIEKRLSEYYLDDVEAYNRQSLLAAGAIRSDLSRQVSLQLPPSEASKIKMQESNRGLSIVSSTAVSSKNCLLDCLQRCWFSCLNCLRTQRATCQALFCGLENVPPPRLLSLKPQSGSGSDQEQTLEVVYQGTT